MFTCTKTPDMFHSHTFYLHCLNTNIHFYVIFTMHFLTIHKLHTNEIHYIFTFYSLTPRGWCVICEQTFNFILELTALKSSLKFLEYWKRKKLSPNTSMQASRLLRFLLRADAGMALLYRKHSLTGTQALSWAPKNLTSTIPSLLVRITLAGQKGKPFSLAQTRMCGLRYKGKCYNDVTNSI